jgi:flagellar hook-length control protein FliK
LVRTASAGALDTQGSDGLAPALPLTAAELRTGLATAFAPAASAPAAPAGGTLAAAKGAQALAPQPAAPAPALPAQSATAEPRAAAQSQAAAPAADAKPATDAAQLADAGTEPVADRPAGGWGVGSAAPAAAATRGAADNSVTLAGPPTAWRQTLHEALGERLNLQLSNRAEQAVIRLEPPMLGRVDIAIRHSAGALEVTISATHGEVLRQLNAVSDNLRSDLAARQFTDVSVTVAQAPRGAQGAQAGQHGDAQGRGRQPGREDQPKDPGRALADAGTPASTFSLNGRA